MDQIYNLDSDSSLLDQLSIWIRNRDIEQKFIYQWDWAKLYYQQKNSNQLYTNCTLEKKDFLTFLNNEVILSWKKVAIISLWCWNSWTEKFIFENIDTTNIDYFWVDSSIDMLKLSIENVKELKMNKNFICADFSTKHFRLELEHSSKWYDDRIFVFFSNTFWNIKHTNIIDILWNLLDTWEKIWLDVRLRKWTSIQDDLELSNIMAGDLARKEIENSYLWVLKHLWVNVEHWQLVMKTSTEKTVWALKFMFSFLFEEKSEINIKWDKLFILPGESVMVQEIYTYDPDKLINFFNEHWFNFLDKQTKWYRWQFLFEKNWSWKTKKRDS